MSNYQKSIGPVKRAIRCRSISCGFAWVIVVSASATACGQGETPLPKVDSHESRGVASPSRTLQVSSNLASTAIPPKVSRYANYVIIRHDLNGDGVLQKSEWQNLQGHPELIDTNSDGTIDHDELTRWIAEYGRRKRIGVPNVPLNSSKPEVPDAVDAKDPQESVEVMGRDPRSESTESMPSERRRDLKYFVPAKRLPQGLPEWFFAKDLDGDGQLTIGEYSPASLAAELEEFANFDANGDGVLTAKECVRKSGASK